MSILGLVPGSAPAISILGITSRSGSLGHGVGFREKASGMHPWCAHWRLCPGTRPCNVGWGWISGMVVRKECKHFGTVLLWHSHRKVVRNQPLQTVLGIGPLKVSLDLMFPNSFPERLSATMGWVRELLLEKCFMNEQLVNERCNGSQAPERGRSPWNGSLEYAIGTVPCNECLGLVFGARGDRPGLGSGGSLWG